MRALLEKIRKRQSTQTESDTKAIAAILGRTYRDVIVEVAEWEGTDTPTAAMMLGQLNALRDRLQGDLKAATQAILTQWDGSWKAHWESGAEAGMAGLEGADVSLLLYQVASDTSVITATAQYVPHLIADVTPEALGRITRAVRNGIILQQPKMMVYTGIKSALLGSPTRLARRRFGGLAYQVERIYRTEAHQLYNQGCDAAGRAAEAHLHVKLVKVWRHGPPNKLSRPDHVALDGEVRKLTEKFSNGLAYPGDPSGAPEDVINCTCWMDVVPADSV